jgi:hypothetical protein
MRRIPYFLIIIISMGTVLVAGCKSSKAAMVETQVASTLSAISATLTAEVLLPTPTPTPVITNTLFGEWRLRSMTEGGKEISPHPEYEIAFKSNGAYNALKDYTPESGAWELSPDGFTIFMDPGEAHQQAWQIIEMTSLLHVRITSGGKTVEYFFEPLFAAQ